LCPTLLPACADHAQARAPGRAAASAAEAPRRPELQLPGDAALPSAATGPYVGVLLPEQAADVVAPQAGLIEGMHAALGEIVNAGQLLVSLSIQQAALEHERAVAERDAARAALDRARFEQTHAQEESQRNQSLAGEGLVTQEQLAQARFKSSESRALSAEAESRLAERSAHAEQLRALRDQTRVTASFRGRIAVRYVSAGARVAAGTPLLRLISDGAVLLRFAIPEQESALQVGSSVELVPALHPELSFQAVVQRIAPEIDAASRMRTVEALPTAADSAQLTEAGLIGAIVNVQLRSGEES
jgi:RND family efflux transporter MFP subunit